jgi:3-oxoacyl-(acyl-carrier-protein) synthase
LSKTAQSKQVAITGVGVVSACGLGFEALKSALLEGREGLSFNSLWDSELTAKFPVGQVTQELIAPPGVSVSHGFDQQTRSGKLALMAVHEARSSEDAYVLLKAGSTNKLSKFLLHQPSQIVDVIAQSFELTGPTMSVMTACSSAANAIGMAADTILSGQADVMLAGGADSLSKIAFNGFCSLKVTSPDGPRPFDTNRQGMMVGEGAGMLVLESLEHAQERGAKVLGMLTGWGHSCDAHHLTAPHPQGTGAKAAMQQALKQAGLSTADIGYINAHGTATIDNDRVEAAAIIEVFGGDVPVSSTKRYTGHTLAAAGGIEAAVSLHALDSTLPANLGCLDVEGGINVLLENQVQAVNHVLSNSFGFGGNNAALVFSNPE